MSGIYLFFCKQTPFELDAFGPLIDMTLQSFPRVLRGSVVKCLTRYPGVSDSSRSVSSGFFVGVPLGETTQSPSLVLGKPRRDMNNVSCHRDTTEILLKVA